MEVGFLHPRRRRLRLQGLQFPTAERRATLPMIDGVRVEDNSLKPIPKPLPEAANRLILEV